MKKYELHRKIFYLLITKEKGIRGNVMAKELNISPKTLRKYLDEVKPSLKKHGAILTTKKGVGYFLTIKDEEEYNDFRNNIISTYLGNSFYLILKGIELIILLENFFKSV